MTATAETQAPDAAYQQLAEHLAERNAELVEEKFALIERLDVAESREQALAAYMERLHSIASRAHGRLACAPLTAIRDGEAAYLALGDVLKEHPETTYLARLIAEKQAEAVYLAVVICSDVEATEYLDDLRRQAEGGES